MGICYFLVIISMLLAIVAQLNVKATYAKYQDIRNGRNMTGAEAARQILDANGLYQVQLQQVSGELSDHYDPWSNTVNLSANVYNGASLSSVGIAAHEVGHAVQHAQDYAPMRLRAAVVPATQIGSMLSYPVILLGLVFGWAPLLNLGILLFSLVVVFQFITLPVEFNASRRAMDSIASLQLLDDSERRGARSVLTAAALTYVAALVTSLLQLLRLLLLRNRR